MRASHPALDQACLPLFFWYSYAARGDLLVLISEMLTRSEAPMRLRPVLVILLLLGFAGPAPAQTPLDDHLQSIPWERYQDEAVRLFQEYLRIDTSNPPGNELAAVEFFHRLFDRKSVV